MLSHRESLLGEDIGGKRGRDDTGSAEQPVSAGYVREFRVRHVELDWRREVSGRSRES